MATVGSPKSFFKQINKAAVGTKKKGGEKLQTKNGVDGISQLKHRNSSFKDTSTVMRKEIQGLQTAGRYVEITKNSRGSCECCRARFAVVLDQIEGSSGPYSPQSQELQPYSRTGNNSLEH